MTDERQVRELFARAARLADDIQPPVARLIASGRRRRAWRAAGSAVTVGVVAAAAFALPAVLRHPGAGGQATAPPGRLISPIVAPATGPDAARLAGFRWSPLPSSPLGALSQTTLVWTGHELLELGGLRHGSTTDDAASFNPATGRWHRIAAVRGNVGLTGAVTAWTGTELFVTNGQTASCLGGAPVTRCLPRAGLYDPATNKWTSTPLPRQLDELTPMAAVWTGSKIILAAVSMNHDRLGMAAYYPASGNWQIIAPPIPPAGHGVRFVAMAATLSRLYLWSMWDHTTRHGKNDFAIRSGVDIFVSGDGITWRDVTGTWPQHQTVATPLYTGHELLFGPSQIWCGAACSPPAASFPGFFADPATLRRSPIPAGPLGQVQPAFVWTGRTLIAVSQGEVSGPHIHIGPDDMAAWDPASHRWFRLPTPPGAPALAALPVWAGHQLLALTDTGALLTLHR